jgi:hypothetical protein
MKRAFIYKRFAESVQSYNPLALKFDATGKVTALEPIDDPSYRSQPPFLSFSRFVQTDLAGKKAGSGCAFIEEQPGSPFYQFFPDVTFSSTGNLAGVGQPTHAVRLEHPDYIATTTCPQKFVDAIEAAMEAFQVEFRFSNQYWAIGENRATDKKKLAEFLLGQLLKLICNRSFLHLTNPDAKHGDSVFYKSYTEIKLALQATLTDKPALWAQLTILLDDYTSFGDLLIKLKKLSQTMEYKAALSEQIPLTCGVASIVFCQQVLNQARLPSTCEVFVCQSTRCDHEYTGFKFGKTIVYADPSTGEIWQLHQESVAGMTMLTPNNTESLYNHEIMKKLPDLADFFEQTTIPGLARTLPKLNPYHLVYAKIFTHCLPYKAAAPQASALGIYAGEKPEPLAKGTRVTLVKLNTEELNGKTGKIIRDIQDGRYGVKLDDVLNAKGKPKKLSVKPENLVAAPTNDHTAAETALARGAGR